MDYNKGWRINNLGFDIKKSMCNKDIIQLKNLCKQENICINSDFTDAVDQMLDDPTEFSIQKISRIDYVHLANYLVANTTGELGNVARHDMFVKTILIWFFT